MKYEAEVRRALERLKVEAPTSKDDVRAMMAARKLEALRSSRDRFRAMERRALALIRRVRYPDIRPRLQRVADDDRSLWVYLRNMVSAAPYKGRLGRRLLYWCVDDNTGGIMGLLEVNGELNILGLRDKHIGWTRERKYGGGLNQVANAGTCICVEPFGWLTGGKFIIVAATSRDISNDWHTRYGDVMAAMTTTSLYGKSSMYNRLREWRYLGTTPGHGIFHVPDNVWHMVKRFCKVNDVWPRSNSVTAAVAGKLETINKVFGVLRLKAEDYSSHQPRGVYFAELGDDTLAFLRGDAATFTPYDRDQVDIADWWIQRWGAMRWPKVRERVESFDWNRYKVDWQIEDCVMRAGSIVTDVPANHVGEPGVTPAPALQSAAENETTTAVMM